MNKVNKQEGYERTSSLLKISGKDTNREQQWSRVIVAQEVVERWAEYYERLLNRPAVDPPLDGRAPEVAGEEEEPTLEEVKTHIGRLKRNKAPGADGVRAELLQVAGCR